MNRLLVASGAAAALLACGPSTTYYRDVKAVFDARCTSCHAAGGIAPFPLTKYEEVHPYREKIRQVTTDRIMPPWQAGPGCADYVGDFSLTDAQVATLARWVQEGGSAGDPKDEPPFTGERRSPSLSRVDRTIAMPLGYAPTKRPDDYRCFVLDWPETTTKFVTGFQAKPGNPAVVHHVIAYLAPPSRVSTYEQLDADEAGPGYTCFGGPGGGSDRSTVWLGGWAPGGRGADYPAGTGLKVTAGSKIILQVHYNTLAGGAQVDQSAVDFQLEAAVAKEAYIVPFTNFAWLGGDGMLIPAGQKEVTHRFAYDPSVFWNSQPYLIHSAGLHMHMLGTRGTVSLKRSSGAQECLLTIPRWDFNWQGSFQFTQAKVARAGDQLAIECHWDNSAENQAVMNGAQLEARDVRWGEGSTDEMCLGIFYVTGL